MIVKTTAALIGDNSRQAALTSYRWKCALGFASLPLSTSATAAPVT